MSIDVRVLGLADEAMIAAAGAEVFDYDVLPASLAEFLRDGRHHLIGAIDDGKLVGFVSAVNYVHPDKPASEYWINEVGVADSHQGRGLGKKLMACALDHARSLECTGAWVATSADNQAANALYTSAGGSAERDQVVYVFALTEDD